MAVVSRPFNHTLPDVGRRMHPIIESSVDLPLPDGPINITISPASTDIATPATAGGGAEAPGPLAYDFVRLSVTIRAVIVSLRGRGRPPALFEWRPLTRPSSSRRPLPATPRQAATVRQWGLRSIPPPLRL